MWYKYHHSDRGSSYTRRHPVRRLNLFGAVEGKRKQNGVYFESTCYAVMKSYKASDNYFSLTEMTVKHNRISQ